jgi:plasmid stabilization system protein ParE
MPQGSKRKYTSKQKRQAQHIQDSYEDRGISERTAAARAWATVNKLDGGGKKSGSGRGKKPNKTSAKKRERATAAGRKTSK